MAQLSRFSTIGVPPVDRLTRWDALLWNSLGPIRTEAASEAFTGTVSFTSCGALRIYRLATSPHRVIGSAGLGLRAAYGQVMLIVQRRGHALLSQQDREARLAPGHWAMCDIDRAYAIANESESEQLIIIMPRDRLALASHDLARQTARCFGEANGTERLLPRYLAGLLDEMGGINDGNLGELVDMAAQLVRLALFESRCAAPIVTMRETLRTRVKDFVRRNLRDPALTIDRVAAAFGCTKRHLHKVFSEDDMTLSQFIWSQRLERCREALSNPVLGRHSITEIAFMWGFNNSGHFSKAFKSRFGAAPGCFRNRVIVGVPNDVMVH